MRTIFDDRYQSEGQGDGPSGESGSDNRSRVSWNSRSYLDPDDDGGRWGGSSSDADDLEKIARS